MDIKASFGMGLVFSDPLIYATASAIGVAKTGTAIGTLHGAAKASATAAWIGLGSMNVGMFIMNLCPIVGGLLVLDSLCSSDYGSALVDWNEEGWKEYEAQCEMEDLKKKVKVDPDHRTVVIDSLTSLAQQESLFKSLEVEHELYLLKKEMYLL